jgi:hypothetical protein
MEKPEDSFLNFPARPRAAAPPFQNEPRLIAPIRYRKFTIKSIFVRRKRFCSTERRLPFVLKILISGTVGCLWTKLLF